MKNRKRVLAAVALVAAAVAVADVNPLSINLMP
jgi:hypothetical protein